MANQNRTTTQRRRLVWVLSAAMLSGGLLIVGISLLDQSLIEWVAEHAAFLIRHPWLTVIPGLLLAAPILWSSNTLFGIALRAIRTQRMPPPGYPLLESARVSYGKSARQRGRILQLLSAIIFLIALLLPIFLTAIFVSLALAFSPV